MAKILSGDIRWADLNPTKGREQPGERPVLTLSEDIFNERSGTVIAMALTSQEPRAGFPLTYEVSSPKLPKRSWVKISRIRTLSTERIGRKIGCLGQAELADVIEGLNEIIGGKHLRTRAPARIEACASTIPRTSESRRWVSHAIPPIQDSLG